MPKASIIRPSVVFGVDDDFFNRFAAMASISPILPLPGGGGTRSQPVYRGRRRGQRHRRAVPSRPRPGKTYEIGGPEQLQLP